MGLWRSLPLYHRSDFYKADIHARCNRTKMESSRLRALFSRLRQTLHNFAKLVYSIGLENYFAHAGLRCLRL